MGVTEPSRLGSVTPALLKPDEGLMYVDGSNGREGGMYIGHANSVIGSRT